MRLSTLAQLATLATLAFGHPGEEHVPLSPAELASRSIAADRRHLAARNCASSVQSFNSARRAKRSLGIDLERRNAERKFAGRQEASSTSSAASPHFTEIQNFTCVTAPEVTEGPYYINNEYIRGNLIEDQPGVALVLDIGVLDIETCEPLPDAFVEIWASNATGVYGGYPAQLGGGGGGPPPSQPSGSGSTSAGPLPSGGPGGPGGPGGGASTPLARNETFLRGGLATDDNGIVELTTIYPGYYSGRTVHVHMMIHTNYDTSENGTIVSHAGNMIHVGQIFFDETWNDKVLATDVYLGNTNNRTLNSEDSILAEQNSGGYNAYMALEQLSADITDGVFGYITIGVNASASYNISNTNYFNSSTTSTVSESISSVSETATSSFIARALGF